MFRKRFLLTKPKRLIGGTLLIGIGVAAFAAANSGSWLANSAKANKARLTPTEVQRQTRPAPFFAVDRATLDRHVIRALDALGNRFESPTQGRSIVTATLTRNTGQPQTTLTIIRELPDKLRIEETSLTPRTFGYDGANAWVGGAPASPEDLQFIESFVRDSVEHFITGQARGDATFHLGDMFRSDDGSDPNYSGPFHDLLRVDDVFRTAQGSQSRPTLFYLNSRTGLPERIVYDRQGDAAKILVEFSAWLTIAGQKTPGRIVWKENGNVTKQLTVSQVTFAPVVQDGIFTAPGVQ
jgi:hypothetical protein